MPLPLEGVRVIDFSRVLARHCAKHLLDLGAEVIKVEPPRGDLTRQAFPRSGDISGYYAQQNAGKRNISIDLNVAGARDAPEAVRHSRYRCREFPACSSPSAWDMRLSRRAIHRALRVDHRLRAAGIVASMAYGPAVQAEVGFTRNTLNQFGVDGADRRTDALTHGDVYAGLHGAIAALAALQHRRLTGQGRYIDVAMAAVLTSINERAHYDLSGVDLGAEQPILGAADAAFFTSPEGFDFVAPFSLVSSVSVRSPRSHAPPGSGPRPPISHSRTARANLAALHAIVQNWIWTFEEQVDVGRSVRRGQGRDRTTPEHQSIQRNALGQGLGDHPRGRRPRQQASRFPHRHGISATTTTTPADTSPPRRTGCRDSQGTRLHRRPNACTHSSGALIEPAREIAAETES